MQTIIFSGLSGEMNLETAKKFIEQKLPNYFGSPDYIEISKDEDKNKIGIEEVKKIISFAFVKPSYGDTKIVLIHESHYLSIEAQNAFLKILEEPPHYLQFVFTVDHPDNLLPTILSRSIIHRLTNSRDIIIPSEYEEIVSSYSEIVEDNIGKRIDWLVKNRSDLSDRDYVLGLIDSLIIHYHQQILSGDAKKIYSSSVQQLMDRKEKILKYNANPLLCIESFLANI